MNNICTLALALAFLMRSSICFGSVAPEALEKFELADLTVVRIYKQSAQFRQPVVVIQDQEEYIHYAVLGMYIGRHKGVLVKINDSAITINELGPDGKDLLKTLPVIRPIK